MNLTIAQLIQEMSLPALMELVKSIETRVDVIAVEIKTENDLIEMSMDDACPDWDADQNKLSWNGDL